MQQCLHLFLFHTGESFCLSSHLGKWEAEVNEIILQENFGFLFCVFGCNTHLLVHKVKYFLILQIVLINTIICNFGNILVWIQLMKNYGWNVIATFRLVKKEISWRYFSGDHAIMNWDVRLPSPEDWCVICIDWDLYLSRILKSVSTCKLLFVSPVLFNVDYVVMFLWLVTSLR